MGSRSYVQCSSGLCTPYVRPTAAVQEPSALCTFVLLVKGLIVGVWIDVGRDNMLW